VFNKGFDYGVRADDHTFVDRLQDYVFFMDANARARRIANAATRKLPTLETTYVVPADRLYNFVSETSRMIERSRVFPTMFDTTLLPHDEFLLSPTRTGPGFQVSVGLAARSPRTVRCTKELLREIGNSCARLGGKVSLAKNVFNSPAEIAAMYGNALRELQEVKMECDPDLVIANEFYENITGPTLPSKTH
jgi:hypothetical protein